MDKVHKPITTQDEIIFAFQFFLITPTKATYALLVLCQVTARLSVTGSYLHARQFVSVFMSTVSVGQSAH
jgi:hypothetical protein